MFITIDHVTKHYGEGDARVTALEDVSAAIDRGEYAVVHGPSGSGKSTLLNIVGGLLRPTAGKLVVDGISLFEDLDGDGLARYRSAYVGFVFQAFNLMPYLNALENVVLPLAHLRLSRKRKQQMAERALERVGLADRMTHLPNELSGGQQQRAAIARAIVNEPVLLIADEPTGNLDRDTREAIMRLFAELNAGGHTLIMVTHDPENVRDARLRIRIDDGRVLEAAMA